MILKNFEKPKAVNIFIFNFQCIR